ncbi:MAG: sigma factor-like helix-turn-helix DNA-binding protein [Lachnospiraceae bacterium]
MEQSSSYDELTIRHQFDRICHLVLEGETVNYFRYLDYRRKHEICWSELSEKELNSFFTMDRYEAENYQFRVLDYDIEVKDSLIAEDLQILTEKKRNVILLSYFMGMSDAEIAREMSLVRSTIHEHRKRSLEMLKNIMEENTDEKGTKNCCNLFGLQQLLSRMS